MTRPDWIIHYVANGAVCDHCGKIEGGFLDGFCNAHTHGMERYHHPDFQMVLDCGPREICRILNRFGFAVRNGSQFHSGRLVAGIYEDCAVKLLEFTECDRTVLRVINPDRHNRFPEDPEGDLPYMMQLKETDEYCQSEGEDQCEENDDGR